MAKAFFLDRDGTLNEDFDFVHKPEQWVWCKGALEAIQWMNKNKYKVIIVTNQSGVARGHFSLEKVHELHRFVDAELKKVGAWIDEWCVAHWHPKFHEGLDSHLLEYRKPGTRYFTEMIKKYDLNAAECVMMGDKPSDLQPALQLGMQAFYIHSRFHATNDKMYLSTHNIEMFENIGEVMEKHFLK